MADKSTHQAKELQQVRARLVDIDDGLSRLAALCHLGGLAADGMQGLHENPSATAFSACFSLLAREIETLRRECGIGR